MYSAPVRWPRPPATAQSTIAAMIHGSQMSYPPYENASQMPRTIVPPAPIADGRVSDLRDRLHPDRAVGRVGASDGDDQDPEEDDRRDVRERAQDVEREDPVVEAHGRAILGQ